MLETSNLAHKYTLICSFKKYTFWCLGPFIFADVSIFCKNIAFFVHYFKKYLYSKQQCESYVRYFLVLFSVFVRQKVTVMENITFADSVSRIRPLDCSKFVKNLKNNNDVTIFQHDVNFKSFWRCFVSLVKFSYWFKFHVNIMTGSGIMRDGFTWKPEIGNTPV